MAEQIVVYTTIFDDYDTLRAPVIRDRSVRWVCITDRVPANTRGWEIRLVESGGVPHPYRDRGHKILSHLAFPAADVTVYLDGHIQLQASPRDIIARYLRTLGPRPLSPSGERRGLRRARRVCPTRQG